MINTRACLLEDFIRFATTPDLVRDGTGNWVMSDRLRSFDVKHDGKFITYYILGVKIVGTNIQFMLQNEGETMGWIIPLYDAGWSYDGHAGMHFVYKNEEGKREHIHIT